MIFFAAAAETISPDNLAPLGCSVTWYASDNIGGAELGMEGLPSMQYDWNSHKPWSECISPQSTHPHHMLLIKSYEGFEVGQSPFGPERNLSHLSNSLTSSISAFGTMGLPD